MFCNQHFQHKSVFILFQLRYLQTLNSISAEKNSTIIFPFPIELLSHFVHPKQPAAPRKPRPPRNIEDSDDIIVQWKNSMAKHFWFQFPIELFSHFVHSKQRAALRSPRPQETKKKVTTLMFNERIEWLNTF